MELHTLIAAIRRETVMIGISMSESEIQILARNLQAMDIEIGEVGVSVAVVAFAVAKGRI